MSCSRLFSHIPLLSPLMPKSCAGHNYHTVWVNLIIFGRDIYQVMKVCSMQEGQLLLFWFFTPINIQQVPVPLQGIYFVLLFLNIYTHKFKVFANIVNPVHIITSEVIIRWFWQKLNKINERIRKNKIIHSTCTLIFVFLLIILVTFHTIFASFYFAFIQYIHDID